MEDISIEETPELVLEPTMIKSRVLKLLGTEVVNKHDHFPGQLCWVVILGCIVLEVTGEAGREVTDGTRPAHFGLEEL
jgi:hypothetical protein